MRLEPECFGEGAVEYADTSEPFNLGTGIETKIRGLAETIREVVGYEGKTVRDTSRPDGRPVRYLDVSRARERIGFEARMPLEEGPRRTVESFRSGSAARRA